MPSFSITRRLRAFSTAKLPMIPRTDSEGNVTWSYDRCERYLGEKASHGCIRLDIRASGKNGGLNAWWVWTHLGRDTKIIVTPEE